MLQWNVDYGFVTGDHWPPRKVSEITWTDIDRPYIVYTSPGIDGPWSVEVTKENASELMGKFSERGVGEYADYFFGLVNNRINQLGIETLFPYFPSISQACINLWETVLQMSSTSFDLFPVIYFKTAQKIVVCQGQYIWGVDGDNLNIIYKGPSIGGTGLDHGAFYYPSDNEWITHWPYFINYNGDLSTISICSIFARASGTAGSIGPNGSIIRQSDEIRDALFVGNPPDGPSGPDNPYEPGGPSGPTNPDLPPGTFDDESDPIPDSSLPTLSAANTGFTRIYNPTLSQVQQLAQYLWTTPDIIETIWNHIKQFFENPMDSIIGFNLVPVPVPDGGTEDFALMFIKTGVMMTVAANQFVDLDCGTLELKRYYGSALDQSPYTKVSCFLPYIGTVNLNTDEVMGTTLQVKYRVDIVSGSCVAKIFVDGNCLYQYSGHCAITIPISSADFSSYVSAAISVGKLAAAAITAGAGVAGSVGVEEVAQQTNQVVTTTQVTNTARNPATGRQITTGTVTTVQTRESPVDQSSTQASFGGLSPQNISNTVGSIMSSKPHIEHSGSFSGNSGYLGVRRPFVIIERPNMCMPANYQSLNGFPSMITMELSTCKGFTRVQQVQLTGLHATNPEQAEILELLKSGVIL